jgi:hypothetical protein
MSAIVSCRETADADVLGTEVGGRRIVLVLEYHSRTGLALGLR